MAGRGRQRDLERARRRERERSLRRERELAARRRARRVGAVGLLGAVVLPFVLWSGTVAGIASQFRLDANYLVTGWSPWLLMALGVTCLAWAGMLDLRNRRARFYQHGTGAWFGWGVTLYLLGFGLATQVAQIADGLSAY